MFEGNSIFNQIMHFLKSMSFQSAQSKSIQNQLNNIDRYNSNDDLLHFAIWSLY